MGGLWDKRAQRRKRVSLRVKAGTWGAQGNPFLVSEILGLSTGRKKGIEGREGKSESEGGGERQRERDRK